MAKPSITNISALLGHLNQHVIGLNEPSLRNIRRCGLQLNDITSTAQMHQEERETPKKEQTKERTDE